MGFQIQIPPDHKSFTATWRDIPLRLSYPDETFFKDQSGGNVEIDYEITAADCGGVNIVYTLHNPTGNNQNLPDFRVEGFQRAEAGDWTYLNTKDFGNLDKIDRSNIESSYINRNYPDAYSPVILTKDNQAAVATSLLYPMLDYKHRVNIRLESVSSGPQSNTWRHIYRGAYVDGGVTKNEFIGPNETRQYSVAVRFAHPRYWLMALSPYKNYFQSLYGSYNGPPADRRPIYKLNVSNRDEDKTTENPRRYNLNLNIHDPTIGWRQVVDDMLGPEGAAGTLNQLGYERIHLWLASGRYDRNQNFMNFPPPFMDLLEYLRISADQEFPRFAADGKQLGFWWGRSDQIPVDSNGNVVYEWGTQQSVIPADYSNPTHISFMTMQLQLALQRGAHTIGLDNFVRMLPWDRYRWTLDMKAMAPGVTFIHEGSGGDLFHSKIGNWYYPGRWDRLTQVSPDVLSRYLNGNSEIWVQQDIAEGATFEIAQQLVKWGYTPVMSRDADLHGLDMTMVACFDGVDNDNDGLTDFPYDLGCMDAEDIDEAGGNQPPFVNAGEDKTVDWPQSQVNLSGSATDDGFPLDPGRLTVQWSRLSGPGEVLFEKMDEAATAATFSQPGEYRLRLSAEDGQDVSTDDVEILFKDSASESLITETKFLVSADLSYADHRQHPPISYQIKEDAHVKLKIMTTNGKTVKTMVDEDQVSGVYKLQWDGKNELDQIVASGIYIAMLSVNNQVLKTKVAVIR